MGTIKEKALTIRREKNYKLCEMPNRREVSRHFIPSASPLLLPTGPATHVVRFHLRNPLGALGWEVLSPAIPLTSKKSPLTKKML